MTGHPSARRGALTAGERWDEPPNREGRPRNAESQVPGVRRRRPWLIAGAAVLIGLWGAGIQAATRVFYDGFESGNTNLWGQDDFRNRCTVQTSSLDGVQGPYAGSRMARCNWDGTALWNAPESFETLIVNPNDANELFYRIRFRLDADLVGEVKTFPDPNAGQPTRPKILRIYRTDPAYNDLFLGPYDTIDNSLNAGGVQISVEEVGSGSHLSWHEVEYYFNRQTGTVKVWIDGETARDNVGLNFNGSPWTPLFITSNWSGADGCCTHDAANHIYFDEAEIFSDATSGTPATGLMSDGSIRAGTPDATPPAAPRGLGVR